MIKSSCKIDISYVNRDALEDHYRQCCNYVDKLADSHKIDNILNSKVALLPPDLMKKYEASLAEQGFHKDK